MGYGKPEGHGILLYHFQGLESHNFNFSVGIKKD